MKYMNKETGDYEELTAIKHEYNELLGNTYQFEEYRDDFEKQVNNKLSEIGESQ